MRRKTGFKKGSLKVTGVYGFNNTARMMLSLAVARLMSEHGNTLFINFETFYGFKGILKGKRMKIFRCIICIQAKS